MPRLSYGLEQVFTNLGIVGAGYKLYFYATGTGTPKTTYTNGNYNVANTNPVILDAAGRAETGIWGMDPSTYRMVLGNPDSTIVTVLLDPIVDVDPVDITSTNNIAGLTPIPTAFWGTTGGTSTNYTLNPALVDITSYSSQQTFIIDFHTACAASPNININNLGSVDLKKKTGAGTQIALQAGDINGRHLCANDGTDIIVLDPQIVYKLQAASANGLPFSNKMVLISNSGVDANNDIVFGTGTAYDRVNNVAFGLSSSLIKRLDAVWAAGTNQGGLDTGSEAPNTWYYCYVVYNPTTNVVDALFTATFGNPTLPSGYTISAYVGAIRNDGSSNIKAFVQNGQFFDFGVMTQDRAAAASPTSPTNVTLTVPAINNIIAKLTWYVVSGGTSYWLIVNPSYGSTTPTISNNNIATSIPGGANQANSGTLLVPTNSSSQVLINCTDTSDLTINTLGWVDTNL